MKSRLPALMMPLSVASEEARAGKEVQARAEPFKRGFAHAASDAVGVNEAAPGCALWNEMPPRRFSPQTREETVWIE